MRRGLLAVALLSVVLTSGCGTTSDTIAVERRIAQLTAYKEVSVFHTAENGVESVRVSVTWLPAGQSLTDKELTDISRVVWTTYRPEFDVLTLSFKATSLRKSTKNDLLAEFGERSLSTSLDDYPGTMGIVLYFHDKWGGMVMFLLIVGAVACYKFKKHVRRKDRLR